MTNVYFIGGEPASFAVADGSSPSLATTGDSRAWRSAWARIAIYAGGSGLDGSNCDMMTPFLPLPPSFWVHAQVWTSRGGGALCKLYDAAGKARIILYGNSPGGGVAIYKINAAGTVTQLAPALVGFPFESLVELNLAVTYATSGGITLYGPGGAVWATYAGDVTTDGVTSLSKVGFSGYNNYGPNTGWSEILVQDTDTRGAGVLSLPITGAGATNSFDSGSYTSVNGAAINDAAFLTSLSAGELFLGATSAAIPSGSWAVTGLAQTARLSVGTGGGPQHASFVLRTNDGANNTGATITPGPFFDNARQVLTINPHTGVAFTTADLVGLQLGIASAA